MYILLGFIIGVVIGIIISNIFDKRYSNGTLKIVRQNEQPPDDLYLFLELDDEPYSLLNKKKVIMNVKVKEL